MAIIQRELLLRLGGGNPSVTLAETDEIYIRVDDLDPFNLSGNAMKPPFCCLLALRVTLTDP